MGQITLKETIYFDITGQTEPYSLPVSIEGLVIKNKINPVNVPIGCPKTKIEVIKTGDPHPRIPNLIQLVAISCDGMDELLCRGCLFQNQS